MHMRRQRTSEVIGEERPGKGMLVCCVASGLLVCCVASETGVVCSSRGVEK